MGRNVSEVAANELCTGCGTCVAFCPQDAIRMVETRAGLLVPQVERERCNSCGVCLRVCPGVRLESGLLMSCGDAFKGEVAAAFVGKATDKQLLAGAQSGGIVTSLLKYLLHSGQIDKALVTTMPDNQALRPVPMATDDLEQVMRARGSKYCPTGLNAVLKDVPKGSRLAMVSLACHTHGVCNARRLGLKMPAESVFIIGLVCDRMMTFHAIDHLVESSGVNAADVSGFEYRSKVWRGWPGDVCIRTRSGANHFVPKETRMLIKDAFTPVRCRLCFDKLNVLADVVVGDAYGFCADKEGASVVLARTPKAMEVLSAAQAARFIDLRAIEPRDVFERQRIDRRRLDWTCYMAAWEKMGRPAPDFGMDRKWLADRSRASIRPYLRRLKWASRLAALKDKRRQKRAVKRHLFLLGISRLPVVKSLVKRLVRRV